ncbi:beta-1,3-galactosyltransferase 5-like [Vanessa cardui]|uniref:beta-1,3-galactosyltransferase 5-like n=1 Tax=Vanessa cardui TaxID=171605 RepID=UPI001F12AE4A|nr:beta-1,3-galactosyltransferase 5-like [Vanessa cardui]
MGDNSALCLQYLIPRKKGIMIRLAFIILTLSSLVSAWWLAGVTGEALLPPLPVQQLDHFRLNRNLKSYLDKIDVLIQPSSTVCSQKKDIPVLVLVTSSPTRFEHREAIRSTWAKHLPTYFIMGLDGPTIEDLLVDNYVEAKKYSDVIIYNFQDHYQNLTLKTALMLKWTSERCPTGLMLFKTDDDVLVNPWMLKRVLHETAGRDLVGYRKMNNYLHRDEYSKWFAPRWLHRQDFISEYLSGTGYLINGKVIKKILETAFEVPMINLEDVYFTYLVAKLRLGLNLTHDHRLSPYRPVVNVGCLFAGLASAHSLAPREMRDSWSRVEAAAKSGFCDHFVDSYWSEWFLY